MIVNETEREEEESIIREQQNWKWWTTKDEHIDLEIVKKRQKGANIYYAINKTMLRKTFRSGYENKRVNAVTVSTILHDCKSWMPLKRHTSQINAAEIKYPRRIVGKTIYDRINSEQIRHAKTRISYDKTWE